MKKKGAKVVDKYVFEPTPEILDKIKKVTFHDQALKMNQELSKQVEKLIGEKSDLLQDLDKNEKLANMSMNLLNQYQNAEREGQLPLLLQPQIY